MGRLLRTAGRDPDRPRFGEPDEIAAAVAYLCSTYTQYVSGATIRVDGGLIRSAF